MPSRIPRTVRIGALDPARREDLYDAVSKVFSHGGYYEFLRWCRECYFEGATYDWSVSRVAECRGQIVAHVGVWDYRMRVGSARLRTGGIGAVMTRPDWRGRGVAGAAMNQTVEAMRRAGYEYAILFGIRDFYHRFGFVPIWPETRHVVEASVLPAARPPLRMRRRPLAEALGGRGEIMRLYDRENALGTGTGLRPKYSRGRREVECWALTGRGGKVCGYLVIKPVGQELLILEAGGFGRGCGPAALLPALRRLAGRHRCLRIVTDNLSYDHPLCQVLRGGHCRVEMVHSRSGGPMGRVLSLRSCLAAMQGELGRRLAASALRDFSGYLRIAGDGQAVTLRLARGRVRLAEGSPRTAHRIAAGSAVAKLILGSDAPRTLALQSPFRSTGAGSELAEVLFPPQWPSLNALDRF